MAEHQHSIEDETPFFRALAKFVLKQRLLSVLIVLGITAFFGHQAVTKLRMETSIEIMDVRGSPSEVRLEEFRDLFGRDDYFLVMVEGDVFTMPFLDKLKKLHLELEKIDLELETIGQRKRDRDSMRDLGIGDAMAKIRAREAQKKTAFDSFGDDALDWDFEGGADEGSIVDEITSLVNYRDTRITEAGIDVAELMDPWPTEADLPALKKKVLTDRSMVGNIIGRSGRFAVIAIRTQFMGDADSYKVNQTIQAILDSYEAPGFKTYISGLPALNDAMNSIAEADAKVLMPLLFVVVIVWLFVMFRSVAAVIGPLIVLVLTFIWTFGTMGILGHPMTILSNILPVFFTCVAVGDVVHLQALYADNRGAGMKQEDAIVSAMGNAGLPVLFTTLTTMAGFFAFTTSPMDVVGMVGLDGGLGVGYALIITMLITPVVLSFNKKGMLSTSANQSEGDAVHRVLDKLLAMSGSQRDAPKSRRFIVFAVVIALSGAAVYGISNLRVWHNPLSWIPADSAIKITFDTMDVEMGGTVDVKLLIEPKGPHGVKDLELLRGLEKLDAHVRKFKNPDTGDPLVGNVASLVDVIKEMNRTVNKGDEAFYRLPDTDAQVADLLFMFETAGPDELRKLVSADLTKSQMSMRIQWLEAGQYRPFAAFIGEGIDEFIGDRANIKPTGAVYNLLTTIDSLIGSLISTFRFAFLSIMVMMVLLMRNIRLAMVAMVVSTIPTMLVFGYMGLTDWPLDMGNLLVAAVAMGIAIDDTIHFFHNCREQYARYGNMVDGVKFSFHHVGRALISTSAILFFGFAVYFFANTKMFITIGLLFCMAVFWALMMDLILGPAILVTVFPEEKK